MTFWGKTIVPNRCKTVRKTDTLTRLRVTRATLDYSIDFESSPPRRISIYCFVGNKSGVTICAFSKNEVSIALDLEFDLTQKVRFKVRGNKAVTLCGYFVDSGKNNQVLDEHAEEDIDYTESESIDDDDSENDYDFYDSFIDDSDLNDDHDNFADL